MSESRTYKLVLWSRQLQMLPMRFWFLEILVLIFFPAKWLGPAHLVNVILIMVVLVGSLIAAVVISSKKSKAEVELTLDETGISRKWIRKFPIQLATNDQVNWNEITGYSIRSEYHWGDVLRLTTKGKKHLCLRHKENILSKDDYLIFIDDLENRVHMHNAHISSQFGLDHPLIKRKANSYEGTMGLVWAVIYAIALLFIPWLLMRGGWSSPSLLIVYMAGLMLWYIEKVYTSRKDRRARKNS